MKALIFDPTKELLDRILNPKEYEAASFNQSVAATGQFIEGSTRPTGRRAYREILGCIESCRNLCGQPTGRDEVGAGNLGIGQGRGRGPGSQTSAGVGQGERGG